MVVNIKRYFNIIAIIGLFVFSFFYLGKINLLIINKSALIEVIESEKEIYEIEAIDAMLDGNNIIPGITGKSVNVLESYYNLRTGLSSVENSLVFDEITPQVSLSNNVDKYIISGNEYKRNISIIVDSNISIENYAQNLNIKINKLIKYEDYTEEDSKYIELINNDTNYFYNMSNYIENNICVVNDSNEDICRAYNYYLIKPSILLSNENFIEIKNNLSSGQIILIDNQLSIEKFTLLYAEILFRGYEIIFLSEMIKE